MTIEAHQLNYLPSQTFHNREMMNRVEMKGNIYNNNNNQQMDFGMPFSESLLPFCNLDWFLPEAIQTTTTSGITYNNPYNNNLSNGSRKRCRDSFQTSPSMDISGKLSRNNTNSNSLSFLGEDISFHIQQQQVETDLMVSQHMERVRLMIMERKKQQTKRLVAGIEERMMNKLREKEEEIEKSMKLNYLLEEKAKALCLENQMLRNIAETNEATANALRSNLEQFLLNHEVKEKEVAEDAESCCGSRGGGGGAGAGAGKDTEISSNSSRWLCRKCGKEESKVVVLPCRHLCVCSFCAPTLDKCPICDTNKRAALHVNMS